MTSAEILTPAKVIAINTVRLIGKVAAIADTAPSPDQAALKLRQQAAAEEHRNLYGLKASFEGEEQRAIVKSITRLAMQRHSGTQSFAVRELAASGMPVRAKAARVIAAVRSGSVRPYEEPKHEYAGGSHRLVAIRDVFIDTACPMPEIQSEMPVLEGDVTTGSVVIPAMTPELLAELDETLAPRLERARQHAAELEEHHRYNAAA